MCKETDIKMTITLLERQLVNARKTHHLPRKPIKEKIKDLQRELMYLKIKREVDNECSVY